MAQKLTAAMPPDLELTANWQVVFRAVDPTTGADVAGVNVSSAALAVENLAGTPSSELAFPELDPLWLPITIAGEL